MALFDALDLEIMGGLSFSIGIVLGALIGYAIKPRRFRHRPY